MMRAERRRPRHAVAPPVRSGRPPRPGNRAVGRPYGGPRRRKATLSPEPPMDFSLPAELVALKERTEAFVREQVIPYENDPRQTPHGPEDGLRRELIARGRAAGLLAPHVGREWGGLGLDHRGRRWCSRRPAIRRWDRSRSTASPPTRPTCICSKRRPKSGTSSVGSDRWRRARSARAS